MKADYGKSSPPVPDLDSVLLGWGATAHRDPSKAGLVLPGRDMVTQSHRTTEVRYQVPSLRSQDPFVPHKCHQPHLEQNGFNQLRHPHSPGSGATKRLGSCPQRTVRLMCLSTLQGSGWTGGGREAGREMGGRERGNGGQLEHRKAKGPLLVLGPQGPAPILQLSPPWLEKGHGEETGEQVPAAGEAAAAVSFTNKYTSLPSEKRGVGRKTGVGGKGEKLPPVLLGLKQ